MRELGFSTLWPKLASPIFTTFRFTRKDQDWRLSEVVKVVYKPRSHADRSELGIAQIVAKEPRWVMEATDEEVKHWAGTFGIKAVTEREAKLDGFVDRAHMVAYMKARYKLRNIMEPMHRVHLSWQEIWVYVPEQKLHITKEWAILLGLEVLNEEATDSNQIRAFSG